MVSFNFNIFFIKRISFVIFIVLVIYLLVQKEVLAEENKDYQNLYYDYSYDEYYDGFDDEQDDEYYEEYGTFKEIYDPLEPVNRVVFVFNDKLDMYIATPIVRGYRFIVPVWGRKGIRNFLRNLKSPITFFNSVLQADAANAGKTVTSFVVNSTIGIGGILDITGSREFYINDEDFGQTLGRYGVGHGVYLVLPILGSSSIRDFSGFVVDRAVDPFDYNVFAIGGEKDFISKPLRWARYGMGLVDKREKYFGVFENVRKTSFDQYSTVRSAFVQNREYEVRNGKIVNNVEDKKEKNEDKSDKM